MSRNRREGHYAGRYALWEIGLSPHMRRLTRKRHKRSRLWPLDLTRKGWYEYMQ